MADVTGPRLVQLASKRELKLIEISAVAGVNSWASVTVKGEGNASLTRTAPNTHVLTFPPTNGRVAFAFSILSNTVYFMNPTANATNLGSMTFSSLDFLLLGAEFSAGEQIDIQIWGDGRAVSP